MLIFDVMNEYRAADIGEMSHDQCCMDQIFKWDKTEFMDDVLKLGNAFYFPRGEN